MLAERGSEEGGDDEEDLEDEDENEFDEDADDIDAILAEEFEVTMVTIQKSRLGVSYILQVEKLPTLV